MKVIDKLYTYGFDKKYKVKNIISKINKGKMIKSLYVVTLPLFGDGLLEIYPYYQLLQPYYKSITDKIVIIGFARSQKDANEIITMLFQELCDLDISLSRECIIEYLEGNQ